MDAADLTSTRNGRPQASDIAQRNLVQLSRKFDPDHLLKGKGRGGQQHLALARPKIDEGEPRRIDRELSERAADHLGTARFVVNSVLRLRQLDYIEARDTAVPGSICAVLPDRTRREAKTACSAEQDGEYGMRHYASLAGSSRPADVGERRISAGQTAWPRTWGRLCAGTPQSGTP